MAQNWAHEASSKCVASIFCLASGTTVSSCQDMNGGQPPSIWWWLRLIGSQFLLVSIRFEELYLIYPIIIHYPYALDNIIWIIVYPIITMSLIIWYEWTSTGNLGNHGFLWIFGVSCNCSPVPFCSTCWLNPVCVDLISEKYPRFLVKPLLSQRFDGFSTRWSPPFI